MSNLEISNKLSPDDKITFRITAEFFGYKEPDGNTSINFVVPSAAPLISKVDNVLYSSKIVNIKKTTGKNFTFTMCRRPTTDYKVNKTHYKLKFKLSSAKAAGDLKVGESVLLASSDSKLSQLNGKGFNILSSEKNDDNTIIILAINNDYTPGSPFPGVVTANGTLTEISKVVKEQEFTVSIPKRVHEGLITKKQLGASPDIGDVEDFVIYAYKRYTKDTNATIKKKLMNNDNEINDNNPPSHDSVVDFRDKPSYSKKFEIDDEKNIEFYITIARYKYTKDGWTGEWLQVNSSDNPIWKRAKKAS